MKIDLEGHELEIIKGTEKTILQSQPLIMLDQFPCEFEEGPSSTIDYLKTLGYELFAVMEKMPNMQIGNFQILSIVANALAALMFGERKELKLKRRFSERYYQFILALSDWIL